MSLELVKSQQLAQYANLFASPEFMNAVKSVTKNDKSGKYNSLLENLEKLSASLDETKTTETDSGESLSLLKAIEGQQKNGVSSVGGASSAQQQVAGDDSMRKMIDELIARADMMEAMLNLDVIPPEDELTDLLAKFRQIISQLDEETRKIHDEVKKKKTGEELKLTPSNSSKSGFNESITLVAK